MSAKDTKVKLVAIDDDPASLDLLAGALEQEGLEILISQDAEAGLEIVRQIRPQIVLVDLVMPKYSGLDVLDRIMEFDPTTDVVLITAHYSTESAVQAIQRGACDYLNKPLPVERIRQRIGELIQEYRRRRRARELDAKFLRACEFQGLIGRSPVMLDIFDRIRRVAPHFRTILVSGPTGTGKELIARALHRLSPVSGRLLQVCNCAAIPETLIESELFGHMKGSFTGAIRDEPGLFEHASGGMLFLDEISELPLTAQAKLLRAIQNQEIQRIGSPATRKVDVRIVAASNRNLRAAVREKVFREDLFYRLSMVEIQLPCLVDRREDLPLLQRHFLQKFSRQYRKGIEGFSRRAEMVLSRYHWPGNIRELENVIGNACMMAPGAQIDVGDLPDYLLAEPTGLDNELVSLDEIQRLHARRVLELVGGNKTEAARILGVSRSTYYRLLAEAPSEAPAEPTNQLEPRS